MKKEFLIIMDVDENRCEEFKTLLKDCVKENGGLLQESTFKDDVLYVTNKSWSDNFKEIMTKLGVVRNSCKGYSLLAGIMLLFSTDNNKQYDNMYQLYSYVSSDYSKTERNIRRLVETVWRNNSPEQISNVFATKLPITDKPLSNRKFIYLLREKLFGE